MIGAHMTTVESCFGARAYNMESHCSPQAASDDQFWMDVWQHWRIIKLKVQGRAPSQVKMRSWMRLDSGSEET